MMPLHWPFGASYSSRGTINSPPAGDVTKLKENSAGTLEGTRCRDRNEGSVSVLPPGTIAVRALERVGSRLLLCLLVFLYLCTFSFCLIRRRVFSRLADCFVEGRTRSQRGL